MPKLFRENPVYVIVPVFILIIGAVFIFAKIGESASEWEKEAAPLSFPNINIKAVTGHFNETLGKYYAWAVGKTNDGTNMAVILRYDPDRSIWLAQEIEVGVDLYGVTYLYDGTNYRLWAVGGNTAQGGYIYRSTDGGLSWVRTGIGVSSKPFYDVVFAFRNPAAPDFSDAYGWTSGNGQGIYMSDNSGSDWSFESAAPGGLDIFGLYALDKDNVWAVGHSGKICNRLAPAKVWVCSQPLAGNPSLKDVYITSDTPPNYKIYAAIDSSRYGYYNSSTWSLVNTSLQGTVTTMYGVSGVKDSNGDYYIWFAGDNGKIINAKNPATTPTRWYSQSTGISNHLAGITVINKTHAWAVGEYSTILKISPGNVAGWGYIGADNCANLCTGPTCPGTDCTPAENVKRTYPAGWLSFNCANLGVCDKTSFSYGVNVKKQREDLATLCPTDASNLQELDVGALSGYAWFGKEKEGGYDPYEKDINATCSVSCYAGTKTCCSNNPTLVCPNNDWCKECLNNPASCSTTGWLSFSRDDTGNPPAAPYNSFPFNTPCNKPINSPTAEDYIISTFDYGSYAVQGWARFKIGQCSNLLSKACFRDADCAPGTCQYNSQSRCQKNWGIKCNVDNDCIIASSKGSCVNNKCSLDNNVYCFTNADCNAGDYRTCDKASGWVKLRGGTRIASPQLYDGVNYIYHPCNACTVVDTDGNPDDIADDNGNEYLTCKICDATYNSRYYACNKCGEQGTGPLDLSKRCGTGRCDGRPNEVCILRPASEGDPSAKDRCHINGWGKCVAIGDYYKTCNTCSFCDPYGVSIDIKEGKWYGYAWSEDFGWIDMKRAGLYSSAWLKTAYGDIYSAANVGSTRTTKAPGYDVSGKACNSTYLILAGNVMQNFCSENYAPGEINSRNLVSTGAPDVSKNPWLVQGYRALEMPTNLKPITLLGKIKYDDLYANKFIEYPDNQSSVNPLLKSSAQPVLLDNKIYGFKKTSYTIDNDITFKSGSGSTGSGAGTLLFNGDLTIKNDITVDELSTLQNIKNLPSPAFYVMGDLTIEPQVRKIVGTFYVEGTITTQSKTGEIDEQLVVKGLMIASAFSFNRTFKGTINFPQPAELITYDGRIQLNSPPGFRDLSKALPKVKESTP